MDKNYTECSYKNHTENTQSKETDEETPVKCTEEELSLNKVILIDKNAETSINCTEESIENNKENDKICPLLNRLIKNLFHPLNPPQAFMQRINNLTFDQITVDLHNTDIEEGDLKTYMKLETVEAKNLICCLTALKARKIDFEAEIEKNLKSVALGMNCSLITNSDLSVIKQKLPFRIYNIFHQIYSYSLIYKRIKSEIANPISLAHRYFLEDSKEIVEEYEKKVVESAGDFYGFYVEMFETFIKLSRMHKISNGFIMHKSAGKREGNFTAVDACMFKYIRRVMNEFSWTYITTGTFFDQYGEYFIKGREIDYGKVPYFISNRVVEIINYIGKNQKMVLGENFNLINKQINIIDDFNLITTKLERLNATIYNKFISNKNQLGDQNNGFDHLIDFVNDIFLFRRNDFINFLFDELKENRNLNRKSILSIIEEGIAVNNIDNCSKVFVDIKVSENNFALYARIHPSLNFLLDSAVFSHKLSMIFNFLWELKRLEKIVTRLCTKEFTSKLVEKHKILKGINLTATILTQHVYYSVVRPNILRIVWNNKETALDLLRREIDKRLDFILQGLFISNKEESSLLTLISCMEEYSIQTVYGKDNKEKLREVLKGFIEKNKKVLGKSLLQGTLERLFEVCE
ncbi:hypothetical protein NUSPORA_00515 [Nucleospora cyclopteri]